MKAVLIILLFLATLLTGKSQDLSCSSTNVQNIYSFTVGSSSPLGQINLYYVQHDGNRQIPLTTTAMYNNLNQQKLFDRVDNFRKHDCTALQTKQTDCKFTYKTTPEQLAYSGKTAFDRGHLTPVNPMRFSAEAIDNTFFCVNIAPQDPYTNQNPWFAVEDLSHQYLATKAGLVMTGLCDKDNVFSPTLNGYSVPDCFWKMICYKDDKNVVQVVAFIGNNTLLNNNDTAGKAKRTTDTTTPTGQQAVLDEMTRDDFILNAWDESSNYLLVNRGEKNSPTPSDCQKARTISNEVRDDWSKQMAVILANMVETTE